MGDYIEISSDSFSSDETILVGNSEINNLVKKYTCNNINLALETPSLSKTTKPCNIYDLDSFSDEDISRRSLKARISSKVSNSEPKTLNSNSWHDKYSSEDFCENSNDFDAILNQISQLEAEQFKEKPQVQISKEVKTLISGVLYEKTKQEGTSHDLFSWNNFSNDVELKEIENNLPSEHQISEEEILKSNYSSLESICENISGNIVRPKRKKSKETNQIDKETQKVKKKLARAAKAKERDQKKQEKEKQKELKSALKVVENYIKPDKCIEYLSVNIDETLSSTAYGEVIKAGLRNSGYNYKVSKQIVPNLISWTRKIPTIQNMLLENTYQQEKHHLLIMNMPELINQITKNTLIGYVQSILSLPKVMHLSIALIGLPKYFKYIKNEENKQFKDKIFQQSEIPKNVNLSFKDLPKLSKKEIDMKLVELQIFCKNIYLRPVEKYEDLAVFVAECTKSVAQIPYKTAKAESLRNESEYFYANNKDCVKVDNNGNGLGRLWNQFLRMFPLASLETAEAISSVYPTIHLLIMAYKNCESQEEAEKLLQDIPVRRAAGPLGGQRRIGPEFSKKAYNFFCSEENIFL